jgi:hypothetical protein
VSLRKGPTSRPSTKLIEKPLRFLCRSNYLFGPKIPVKLFPRQIAEFAIRVAQCPSGARASAYRNQHIDSMRLRPSSCVQLEILLASSKRDRGVIAGGPGRRPWSAARCADQARKNDPVQRRAIEPAVSAVLQMQRRRVILNKGHSTSVNSDGTTGLLRHFPCGEKLKAVRSGGTWLQPTA